MHVVARARSEDSVTPPPSSQGVLIQPNTSKPERALHTYPSPEESDVLDSGGLCQSLLTSCVPRPEPVFTHFQGRVEEVEQNREYDAAQELSP